MTEVAIPREEAWATLALWSVAAALWIASSLLGWPLWIGIGAISVALVGQVTWARFRGRERLSDFGVRADNFARAAAPVFAVTAALAAAALAVAAARRTPLHLGSLLPMLVLYPLWGIAQQTVIQGVIHRRLVQLGTPRAAAIGITAVVFASLHVANRSVLVATLAMGFVWSWSFARWPNAVVIGISHGVLAALAYPILFGENPL